MSRFNLEGTSGGGDGLNTLSQILEQLLELQGGGGSRKTTKTQEAAAPSAAPLGQATATAGVQGNAPAGRVPMKAPIPKGMPTGQGAGQMTSLGSEAGGGINTGGYDFGMSDLYGGRDYSTGEGYSLQTDRNASGGYTTTDIGNIPSSSDMGSGKDYGELGGALRSITDLPFDIASYFSMDESEKAARAQRHLMEQQFEIRQNWKGVYEDFLLPMQTGTKMHAYQQLGKKSENYEYATDMLKGMIEGSASVYAGQKEWDEVWSGLAEIPDENVPDSFMESWQSHYQNDDVNNTSLAITTKIFDSLMPNLPQGIAFGLALEMLKMGNATIQATKDYRNMTTA